MIITTHGVSKNGQIQGFQNLEKELINFQEAKKVQEEQSEKIDLVGEVDHGSDVFENEFSFFHSNNHIFDHENMVFLFIDSEFDGPTYISLQVVGCFYLEGKFELFSFIVFNMEFEFFVKTHFSRRS